MLSHQRSTTTSSRPVSPRDRYWSNYRIAMTYGPLVLPPLEDLRRGAALLAQEWPASRIGVLLDRASSRWVPHPGGHQAAGEAAVVAVEASCGHEAVGVNAHTAAVIAQTPHEVMVAFVVSGDHITCLVNHAVGDASIASQLVPALLAAALTGEVPPAFLRPSLARPLLTAVVRTYRDEPRLLLEPWRQARAVRASVPAPRRGDGAADPAATPSAVRPQGPLEVRHAVMAQARLREVNAWRREQAPGASMAAVMVCLARACLVEVGLEPTGAPGMLVDLRRYLPPEATYFGNLATGMALGPGVEWHPQALTRHLRDGLESALPLWDVARGEAIGLLAELKARALGRRRPVPVADTAGPADGERPRPRLTVSSLPRVSSRDGLPWAAEPVDCTIATLLTPSSPTAVTVSTSDLRGQLQLSITFDAGVFDADLLDRAVALMACDPVPVLQAHTQTWVRA